MKKLLLILLVFVSTSAYADPWRIVKYAQPSPFYGSPFKILKVKVVKEVEKGNKVYYQYKIIMQRPSWDDTRGVARTNATDLRLYYFAASPGYNPYWSLYKGLTVGQFKKKNYPRKIVIYLFEGFSPSRKPMRIRIGAIPYPMIAGYDIRSAISVYKSDYITLLEILLKRTSLAGAIIGKVKDMSIDSVINRILTHYGAVIDLEVLAKVPNIKGLPISTAQRELRIRTLKPHITGYVSTNDRRLHNRVKGISRPIRYISGNRVRAMTQISFNVYKYIGNQRRPTHRYTREICGDGVDNDGDGLIDEGCYKKYIIIKDSKCKDDVTGLIIDGRKIGASPPGRQKYFDMKWLSKGIHTMTIEAVKSFGKRMGCADTDEVTYSVELSKGIKFLNGGRFDSSSVRANGKVYQKFKSYKIKVY